MQIDNGIDFCVLIIHMLLLAQIGHIPGGDASRQRHAAAFQEGFVPRGHRFTVDYPTHHRVQVWLFGPQKETIWPWAGDN